MKKIKVMLMCICLAAVAGGVLAFKAMIPSNSCTVAAITTQLGGALTCQIKGGFTLLCPNYIAFHTTTSGSPNTICGTTARFDEEEQTFTCTDENGQALQCSPTLARTIQ